MGWSAAFADDPCARVLEFEVRGESMAPFLRSGQVVRGVPFSCVSSVKKGDLAVFSTGAHPAAPVIKRIVAVGGDRLVVDDGGRVFVNGDAALGADGAPYIASGRAARMVRFYQGVLRAGTFLVLGREGSLDSGRIGVIDGRDIVAIVRHD